MREFSAKTKLQDAQGNRIPRQGAKRVEISLRDLDGREVVSQSECDLQF